MPVTPTGRLIKPVTELKELLAQSTSFQAWIGVATPTLAKLQIFLFQAPGDTAFLRYAQVGRGGNLAYDRVAVGSGDGAFDITDGSQFAFYEDVTAKGGYLEDNVIDFMNNVSLFLTDIIALQSSGTANKRINTLVEDGSLPLHWPDGERQGYQMQFMEEQSV